VLPVIDVSPLVARALVCNIGDMLDRLTGGWYRSTPHRVRNLSGHGRLSFPFFLDPGFAAEVPPLPARAAAGDDGRRSWDGQDLRAFTGTFGDYLLGKSRRSSPSSAVTSSNSEPPGPPVTGAI
jgi:isopenicillin N synthase-like dioxygenase